MLNLSKVTLLLETPPDLNAPDAPVPIWKAWTKDFFAIIILSLVILAFLAILAYLIRRKKTSTIKIDNRYEELEDDLSLFNRKSKRKRKYKRRYPTLAETGGLPPIKEKYLKDQANTKTPGDINPQAHGINNVPQQDNH